MATAFANTTSSSNLYLHRCRKNHPLPSPSFFSPFRSYPLPSQTLFLVPTPKPVRRIAVAPLGPPTPPSPDPPPPKNTTELTSSSCGSSVDDSRPCKDLSFSTNLDLSLLLGFGFTRKRQQR
ncbi:hypothetical protein AtNW77_Chr1g0052201 [Arabidopsis thaliana]